MKLTHYIKAGLVVCLLVVPMMSANATVYRLPKQGDVVGKVHVAHAHPGQTLWKMGRRYDIGIDEMIRVNPGYNPLMPMRGGTRVVIPSRFILPPGPREGIVINLAELRLYYYPKGRNVVVTKPVGIGKEGWSTPRGSTTVTRKRKNPTWRPTANVRAEAASKGYIIPHVFPPGPENPLGPYAMNLGWPTYVIHGTNRPEGVGGRVSAGCIRMWNEDIAELFRQVPVGTPVRVIHEPFKVGWHHNKLYMEAHEPLSEDIHKYKFNFGPMVAKVYKAIEGKAIKVRWKTAKSLARQYHGVPELIGRVAKQQ